jgi:hypothetical protein
VIAQHRPTKNVASAPVGEMDDLRKDCLRPTCRLGGEMLAYHRLDCRVNVAETGGHPSARGTAHRLEEDLQRAVPTANPQQR